MSVVGVGGTTSSSNSRASAVPGASAASTKLHHLLLGLLIVLCHDVNRVRDRQGGPRVAHKARGTPDRPPASCRGSGALPATLPRPSDPSSHSRAWQTTPPSERKGCARVAQKARELLIALLLHTEARGLFLQTCRGPSDPNSHSGARQTR